MVRKLVTVLIVLSFLPLAMLAQEKIVLKPKAMTVVRHMQNNSNESKPLYKVTNKVYKDQKTVGPVVQPQSPQNLIDTLYTITDPYNTTSYGSNFGFFGQDRMIMWFEAPADLFLNQVGFAFYSAYVPVANVEVKVVEVVRPRDELEYLNDDWWGWYEATGNGYHDATALLDDPDRTGNWLPSANAPDPGEIFGNDIWSDLGVGLTFTPVTDSVTVTYQFIDLNALGYPDISAGTIFAIVIKNTAPALNASRVGLRGTTVGTGGVNQFSLWKFYADGNTNAGTPPDDWGWWSRDETLGFAAVVEIYGNTAPDINSFTVTTGGDLGPWTIDANITDENPGDPGNAGVQSAMIQWSTDGGANWNDVPMTGTEPNFTGEIPAQSPFVKITYRISATDVTNLTSNSSVVNFWTFAPSGAPSLVIWNGFPDPVQEPYWGETTNFEHDSWVSGAIPDVALLNNYTNVIEIWNENAGSYNDDVVRQWLEADGSRNYLLAGQEWLGAKNGYVDSTYSAGSFEYDILGVAHSYNDISYDGTSGQAIPTLLTPESGTMFGQPLLDLFNSVPNNPDSLMFNPGWITGNSNWQDGFDVVSGVTVDMMVETRGVGGVPSVQTFPTLAHHTLSGGNKVIFHSYDPISLTTADDDSYSYYYWVGADTMNSVYQALRWFGVTITDVEPISGASPTDFSLQQNYPNPFNPATTIEFSIPEQSLVTLKIYDVLGREVATVVNEEKIAGSYKVKFDASQLASGLYIYTIKANNFTSSKKMMLLK